MPDARERLETAAFDLFEEQGYESTTVAQIAERAGLNRATFFRHFTDKREAVLAGEDVLTKLFVEGVHGAAPNSDAATCLHAALVATGTVMTPQRRAAALRRIAIVGTNPELQERGELKFAHLAEAIAQALRQRGIDDLSARLAAELGLLAFRVGFERWLRAAVDSDFVPIATDTLSELRVRASAF